MPAVDRKTGPKPTPQRASRTQRSKGKSRIVSVETNSAGVRVEGDRIVVLSTDAKLRRLIVDSIAQGPEIQQLVQRLTKALNAAQARMAKALRHTELGLKALREEERARAAEAELKSRIADGEPTTEQMEAREALYQEMLKHGPAPTAEEIADAFGSWA